MKSQSSRADVYSRVTNKIITDLEQGVRPWMKPWNGEHAACRIPLPLRHCGTSYRGINIPLLWGEMMERGYAASKWMTYKPRGPTDSVRLLRVSERTTASLLRQIECAERQQGLEVFDRPGVRQSIE